MTTKIYGYSDDTICVEGDLDEDFSVFFYPTGKLFCSDGTEMDYRYDDDGLWRFDIVNQGTLFLKKIEGKVEDDEGDTVLFKDGLKKVSIKRGAREE